MTIHNTMIPEWSFFYFFKKIRPFSLVVVIGILLTIVSTLLSFSITKIIQLIIDNYQTVNIFHIGIILFAVTLINEVVWYFVRKQIESFTIKFKDYIRTELYYDIVRQIKYFDKDASELKSTMSEYLSSCYYLSGGFIFSFFGKVTGIFISFVIVYNLGFLPLIANILAIGLFVMLSYFFSKQYVVVSKKYSQSSIAFESLLDRLFLSIDFISRNRDFSDYHTEKRTDKWNKYSDVKDLHAKRWFWQLTPFKIVYVLSIVILVMRIQTGLNSIGDIVLLQWYYSTILGASIFVTESFTDLAKQKASSQIAFEKLYSIINFEPRESDLGKLTIETGKSYLISGKNGSGKTTMLYDYIYRTDKKVVSYLSGEKYPYEIDISSGENQKKAVREVFYKQADVYIFDEPCSNTDSTEWFIEILKSLKGNGLTSITVTHKPINFDFDLIIGENYDKHI